MVLSTACNIDFMYRSCFEDTDRFQLLLMQLSKNLALGISDNGHKYAVYLASQSIIPSSFNIENLMGITQVS